MLSAILDKLPELGEWLPEQLEPVALGQGSARVVGRTSHPGIFEPGWGNRPIGAAFFALTPALPEGFFAVGTHSTEFEYVFVMWVRGGRRFLFRDYYSGGGWDGVEGADLVGRARTNLRHTLAAWVGTAEPFVSNLPFVPPGVGSRSPRPIDVAIAHVVTHRLSTGSYFVDVKGEQMSADESKPPLSTSQMRSMVMVVMGCLPEGPVDMRMVVQALAKGSPANFGNVIPVTPGHLAHVEAGRDEAQHKLWRVRQLHTRADDGACSCCRDGAWPCSTLRAIIEPAGSVGEAAAAC